MLGQTMSSMIQSAALLGTFILSGIPQTIEAICIAGTGKLDTHVLMSLAVIGTVFLGMAQEGALLLLLFQVSHTLEEKFTARARGNLDRLFSSVPTQATLIELDLVGDPMMHTASTTIATAVKPGQFVLVKPGEQVPLDGQVTWGIAGVSMQHISGESQLVRMQVGSTVPAGSLNIDGLLVVRVTATAHESTPARIARMTEAAQIAKPKLKRTLDRVGEIWSKAVVGVTLATVVILPLLGVPLFAPQGALYRAMGVLTAGSPCAVVLVPLAYVCAISTITRKGVLMKSAASLDLLNQCGTVALDKTGTLTTGLLTLTDVRVLSQAQDDMDLVLVDQPGEQLDELASPRESDQRWTRNTSMSSTNSSSSLYSVGPDSEDDDSDSSSGISAAMQYSLSLALSSNHPVSRAVVTAAGAGVDHQVCQISHFEQVPGLGVSGVCRLFPDTEPMTVRFGSLEFIKLNLRKDSVAARTLAETEAMQARSPSSKAMSFLLVTPFEGAPGEQASRTQQLNSAQPSSEPALMAMFCFEDVIEPGALQAVAALQDGTWRHKQGKKEDSKDVVMLTGDAQQVAQHVAQQLSIKNFHAGLKPDAKLSFISSFNDLKVDATGTNNNVAQGNPKRSGLLMMGDGINDAPALAAAHVGVAVASTPDDMVSAAADVIVLNGLGVSNLPWLFKMAHKTQVIIKQNLALALLSVIFATLPTIAGIFPLWLAVLLHEGATVMVVLNSLRLLLDPQTSSIAEAISSSVQALKEMFANGAGHSHDHGGHEHDEHGHGHAHGQNDNHDNNHVHLKMA